MTEPEVIQKRKKGVVREYAEALLTALLVAFVIRSFVIEAFKIPSGSMIPTLMIGDHIFVNKFVYSLRIPFTKKRIATFRMPERGDAVVFIYPLDESKDFIKRVIGLPGDRISLKGDDVLVNGVPLERHPIRIAADVARQSRLLPIIPDAVADQAGIQMLSAFPGWQEYDYFVEKTDNVSHLIQFDSHPSYASRELVVPNGQLFVMGDNRDNSADSREWGFVPLENVKGKAMFVWLSIDYDRKNLRWDRFGKLIR